MGRALARRGAESRGTAVVEMAFVLPLLVLLALGIVDFGRAMNYVNDATHLANEAARYAVVNRNPGGGTSLQDWIKEQADTAELRDSAQVCIEFPAGSIQVGQPVKVTVTFDFGWLNYIGGELLTPSSSFSSSSTMRLEQLPSNYSEGCSS